MKISSFAFYWFMLKFALRSQNFPQVHPAFFWNLLNSAQFSAYCSEVLFTFYWNIHLLKNYFSYILFTFSLLILNFGLTEIEFFDRHIFENDILQLIMFHKHRSFSPIFWLLTFLIIINHWCSLFPSFLTWNVSQTCSFSPKLLF